MCDPVILGGLSALSAITSFIGQSASASAQDRQIQRGQQIQDAAFAAQRADIQDEAESKISDRVKQAARERGALRVAQGESGLAGVTFQRLENDISFQSGSDISRIQTNARKKTEANKRNRNASLHRSQSNALQVNRPSLISTGLQIGGAIGGGIHQKNVNSK